MYPSALHEFEVMTQSWNKARPALHEKFNLILSFVKNISTKRPVSLILKDRCTQDSFIGIYSSETTVSDLFLRYSAYTFDIKYNCTESH